MGQGRNKFKKNDMFLKNRKNNILICNKFVVTLSHYDDVSFLISKHENTLDFNNLEDPVMKNIVQYIQILKKSVNNTLKMIQESKDKSGNAHNFLDLLQLH